MCVGALPSMVKKNPMWAISPALAAFGVGKKKKPGVISETGATAVAPTYGASPSIGG